MIDMEKKEFTQEQRSEMQNLVRRFLEIVDPNPDRPGLIETPNRVVKYWTELLEGQLYTNDEIADMFDKTFMDVQTHDLVIERNIEIFSHCEHHLALMYDMNVTIAYIPKDRVIGLSKMARIAEMVGKRLQLQEKIGVDINYIMRRVLKTDDVAVLITGKHGCMTARGIKSRNAVTRTAALNGRFLTDASLRNEVYQLCKIDK